MTQKIKIIFAGTPEISVPLLESLTQDDRFEVALVITQVDKKAGRKMELTSSPIKVKAMDMGLDVFQPDNINSPESIELIKEKDVDLIMVMAYGQIFKPELLSIPKTGCLNVHASLLPKYRGASPIQSALLNGETETGIGLMKMEEGMDTGPVYKSFTVEIKPEDNAKTLSVKLSNLSAEKIPNELIELNDPKPQSKEGASNCAKIKKEDGLINWNEDANTIFNKIRAFYGWPGTYTFFNGKRLKIITTDLNEKYEDTEAGKAIHINYKVLIGTKKGLIQPLEVQLEGKQSQTINEFINGNPDFINSKLTSTP